MDSARRALHPSIGILFWEGLEGARHADGGGIGGESLFLLPLCIFVFFFFDAKGGDLVYERQRKRFIQRELD